MELCWWYRIPAVRFGNVVSDDLDGRGHQVPAWNQRQLGYDKEKGWCAKIHVALDLVKELFRVDFWQMYYASCSASHLKLDREASRDRV
jgi:hypothetical protein